MTAAHHTRSCRACTGRSPQRRLRSKARASPRRDLVSAPARRTLRWLPHLARSTYRGLSQGCSRLYRGLRCSRGARGRSLRRSRRRRLVGYGRGRTQCKGCGGRCNSCMLSDSSNCMHTPREGTTRWHGYVHVARRRHLDCHYIVTSDLHRSHYGSLEDLTCPKVPVNTVLSVLIMIDL